MLAFGKLGGEELNYSSDIDLVFVCEGGRGRYWGLGQKLIKAHQRADGGGFLYRVDMRLRPWGRSGPLVNDGRCLRRLSQEARTAVGEAGPAEGAAHRRRSCGRATRLAQAARAVHLSTSIAEAARANVADMKQKHRAAAREAGARRGARSKGARGASATSSSSCSTCSWSTAARSRRSAASTRSMRSSGWPTSISCRPTSIRQLTSGYIFLRTIEHSLQLMHNKQEHSLPRATARAGVSRPAARLSRTPTSSSRITTQHCRAIRAIYEKYILGGEQASTPVALPQRTVDYALRHGRGASYREIFNDEQAERHLRLLEQLDEQKMIAPRGPALAGRHVGADGRRLRPPRRSVDDVRLALRVRLQHRSGLASSRVRAGVRAETRRRASGGAMNGGGSMSTCSPSAPAEDAGAGRRLDEVLEPTSANCCGCRVQGKRTKRRAARQARRPGAAGSRAAAAKLDDAASGRDRDRQRRRSRMHGAAHSRPRTRSASCTS